MNSDVVDGHDIRVRNLRHLTSLLQKRLLELFLIVLVSAEQRQLDRHRSTQLRIVAEVDRSEGSLPEHPLNLIPADLLWRR